MYVHPNPSDTMRSSLMIHPTLPARQVKCGFNIGALLFGTLWAYAEGLMVQGGRMAAADAAAAIFVYAGQPALVVAGLILFAAKNVYAARHGGTWIRTQLVHQGYREAGGEST